MAKTILGDYHGDAGHSYAELFPGGALVISVEGWDLSPRQITLGPLALGELLNLLEKVGLAKKL